MKKRIYNKKYFIKPDNQSAICVVKDDFFKDLNKTEALCFGLSTFLEIKRTLKEDALYGDDSFIGNMKVTTGLERFLNKLNEEFPYILNEIQFLSLRFDGSRVYKC